MNPLAPPPTSQDKCTQAANHFQNAEYERAANLIQEALLEEQTSERWNDWASAKFLSNRSTEAELGFRRALEMDPENIQSTANLGILLACLDRGREAIPILEKAVLMADGLQRIKLTHLLNSCRTKLASHELGQSQAKARRSSPEAHFQIPIAAAQPASGLSIDGLLQQQYWEQIKQTPRYLDKKRLPRFGAKAYSQSDEDGIIAEIFRRIGAGNRTFIEFGVGCGLENNTLALLLSGWRGLWIEACTSDVAAARSKLSPYLGMNQVRIENQFVTKDNVDSLLAQAGPGPEVDLLSIDVDGNDYWIWDAIHSISARVVVIEYNAAWFPPLALAVRYQENFRWDRSNYFGTSLKALEILASRKGYRLVGCNCTGVNAFFVRADLCQGQFCEPFTAENHFEPPRFWMVRPAGHPPSIGPLVQIEDL